MAKRSLLSRCPSYYAFFAPVFLVEKLQLKYMDMVFVRGAQILYGPSWAAFCYLEIWGAS